MWRTLKTKTLLNEINESSFLLHIDYSLLLLILYSASRVSHMASAGRLLGKKRICYSSVVASTVVAGRLRVGALHAILDNNALVMLVDTLAREIVEWGRISWDRVVGVTLNDS